MKYLARTEAWVRPLLTTRIDFVMDINMKDEKNIA